MHTHALAAHIRVLTALEQPVSAAATLAEPTVIACNINMEVRRDSLFAWMRDAFIN